MAAAHAPGTVLDRLERVIRGVFATLFEHREIPRLMLHVLAADRPVPSTALRYIRANFATLTELIADGQAHGELREGEPRFLALSIVAQPIWFVMAEKIIRAGHLAEPDQPDERHDIVESVVDFVRAGLVQHRRS